MCAVSVGCSTGNFYLATEQKEVEVYLKQTGQRKAEKVGVTPLRRPLDKLLNGKSSGKGFVIELKKEGFISKEVFLPDYISGQDIEIRTSLQEEPISEVDENGQMRSPAAVQAALIKEQQDKVERTYETNRIIDQVFEIKRLIHVGRNTEASDRIEKMKQANPDLSVLYELQGGISYIAKDYRRALDEYRVALKIHPENMQILNMKRYLEKLLGEEVSR